jgi:ankyrin repeat protein
MSRTGDPDQGPADSALLTLFRAIAANGQPEISRFLRPSDDISRFAIHIGASRSDPDTYFLAPIRDYVYRGDTPLHIAAAAYQIDLSDALLAKGARVRARNRRGAEPLHYAADGIRVATTGTQPHNAG